MIETKLQTYQGHSLLDEAPLKVFISLNSSLNITTRLLELMTSERSMTYKRKRAGPSMEGTPEVTERSSEVAPSTVTRWRRPES